MNLLKNILNKIYQIIINVYLFSIIRKEDRIKKNLSSNNFTNDDKFLQERGYIFLDNFFSDKEVDNFNNQMDFNKKKRNCSISDIIVQRNNILEKIILNKRVNSLITNYLGNDAKLDFIEINRIKSNPEKKSVSEKWHYDCVGKRLKIFIFLNNCENIFTDYVEGTNKVNHTSFTTNGSRKSDKFIRKKYKNFYRATPKKGAVFIFDTNGYHQGSYRSSSEIEYRDTIQIEYSDFLKSKKLNHFGIDSIGIRDVFFDKTFDFKDSLVEKECLSYFEKNNFYFYDYKFSHF